MFDPATCRVFNADLKMLRSELAASDHTFEAEALEAGSILVFLRRRWGVIAGISLLWLLSAGAYLAVVTPTFTATSQILIDPRKATVFGTDSVNSEPSLDAGFVDSQISVITSSGLLNKVVEKEQLYNDAEFGQTATPGLLGLLFGSLFRAPAAVIAENDVIAARNARSIARLRDFIDVQRIGKGNVLAVTVTSISASKASRIANAIANAFLDNQIEVRTSATRQAAGWFRDQLEGLREQVRRSEQALADFRTEHRIFSATSEGKVTVGEQQLAELNIKLANATVDTAEKSARYQQARAIANNAGKLEDLPDAMRYGSIPQLRTQQNELARREEELLAVVGPLFPAVSSLRAEREGIRRAIAREVARLVDTLKHDVESAKLRESFLQASIQKLSNLSGSNTEVGVQLRELERTNLANKALFESYLSRAKQTQVQAGFEEQDARLISPALTPTLPASPKIPLVLGLALTMGLITGMVFAGLLELSMKVKEQTVVVDPISFVQEDTTDSFPSETSTVIAAASLPDNDHSSPPEQPVRDRAASVEAPIAVHVSPTTVSEVRKELQRTDVPDIAIFVEDQGQTDVDASFVAPAAKIAERSFPAVPEAQEADDARILPFQSALGREPGSAISDGARLFNSKKPNATLEGSLRLPDVSAGPSMVATGVSERRFRGDLNHVIRMIRRMKYQSSFQTILVTATNQADNTSLVATALAATIAAADMRVLLVDAEIERSAVSSIYMMRNRHGLTDTLLMPSQLRNAIVSVGTFDLLPRGSASIGVIAHDRLRQSLASIDFFARYDWVVFNSPSLWRSGDWAWLSPVASAILTVDNSEAFSPPDSLFGRDLKVS